MEKNILGIFDGFFAIFMIFIIIAVIATSELNAVTENAAKKITELKSEIFLLKNENRDLKLENGELKSELAEKKLHLEELDHSLNRLIKNLEMLNEKFKKRGKTNKFMNGATVADFYSSILPVNTVQMVQTRPNQSRLDKIEHANKLMGELIEELEKQLLEQNKKMDQLQIKLEKLTKILLRYWREKKPNTPPPSDLHDLVRILLGELEKLTKLIEEKEQDINLLELNLINLSVKIDRLIGKIQEVRNILREGKAKQNQQNVILRKTSAAVLASNESSKQFEAKVNKATDLIELLIDDINQILLEKDNQLELLRNELNRIREALARISWDEEIGKPMGANAADAIKDIESLVGELRDEIKDLKTKIADLTPHTIPFIDTKREVLFDSGKSKIKAEFEEKLDSTLPAIKNYLEGINTPDNIKYNWIQIEGHTDDVPVRPPDRYGDDGNWDLSLARSKAVMRYFVRKGISPQCLSVVGHSKYKPKLPINPSDQLEDVVDFRSSNRRIEIVFFRNKKNDGVNCLEQRP